MDCHLHRCQRVGRIEGIADVEYQIAGIGSRQTIVQAQELIGIRYCDDIEQVELRSKLTLDVGLCLRVAYHA